MSFQPLDKINIEYLELVVTTKCTLKCKDCANLIPLYKNPYSIEFNVIKESLLILLENVESIEKFRILGGEPFLYDDLDKVINLTLKEDKIKKVEIVTNGTIYPQNMKLIETMINEKIKVVISDYGDLSKNKDKLLQMKKKYGINAELLKIDYWLDYSKIHCRNRSESDLQQQYTRCNHQCMSLFNGVLYECPRCGHGMDLGIIEKKENEYINLLEDNADNIGEKLIKTFSGNKKFISACNYCDVERNIKKIPVALQL